MKNQNAHLTYLLIISESNKKACINNNFSKNHSLSTYQVPTTYKSLSVLWVNAMCICWANHRQDRRFKVRRVQKL